MYQSIRNSLQEVKGELIKSCHPSHLIARTSPIHSIILEDAAYGQLAGTSAFAILMLVPSVLVIVLLQKLLPRSIRTGSITM
jgi:ABC-type glycerol-3-phosphate transport system permease component